VCERVENVGTLNAFSVLVEFSIVVHLMQCVW
jgi:hypothetical protein